MNIHYLISASIIQILTEIDTKIFLWINGMHTPYLDNFMQLCSLKWTWIPLYAAFLYIMLRNFKKKENIIYIISAIIIIGLCDHLSVQVLRPIFERMRPSNLDNPISGMVHIVDGYRSGRYGFPSSHASNVWGGTFFIIYMFRNKWLSLFMIVWATIICYSRSYLGVHYPGDLLAGMLLGFINSSLVCLLMKYIGRKHITVFKRDNLPVKHIYSPVLMGIGTFIIISILSFFTGTS